VPFGTLREQHGLSAELGATLSQGPVHAQSSIVAEGRRKLGIRRKSSGLGEYEGSFGRADERQRDLLFGHRAGLEPRVRGVASIAREKRSLFVAQIGVEVEHRQSETSPYLAAMSSGNFDVAVDFSNLFMDEPSLGLAKYVSFDRAPENRSRSIDRDLDLLPGDVVASRTRCGAGSRCNSTTRMCECVPRCADPSAIACGAPVTNSCPGQTCPGVGVMCPTGLVCDTAMRRCVRRPLPQ
jgi:hypothetical protein